ncbi:MAG: aconitase X catalytic domain-containing protein [Chloroflexi bacterium]|nr:aconitase X catalytic domain-containing protein [Chloroflexota bacterium]
MYLTDDEKRMMQGEFGEPVRWATEFMVKQGEFFEAPSLVDIGYASVCDDPAQLGKWWPKTVTSLASQGLRFRVPTGTNVAGADFDRWRELGVEEEAVREGVAFARTIAQMGAVATHSQDTYLLGFIPRLGEHVAYTESQTVTFVNSYFGARSNLEGYPGAFIAAIIGKAPRYGFHLEENRYGNVVINVSASLGELSDYDALGYWAGNELKEYGLVPIFTNLPKSLPIDALRRLSCAMPTTGSTCIFHAVGITPEAATLEQAQGGRKPLREMQVTDRDIRSIYDMYPGQGRVDMLWLGNPPLSIWEMMGLAREFNGRKARADVEVMVFTSEPVKAMADRMGLSRALEEAGCDVYCSICPTVIAGKQFPARLEGKTILTDDVKNCHYGVSLYPGKIKAQLVFRPRSDCVQAAIKGRL